MQVEKTKNPISLILLFLFPGVLVTIGYILLIKPIETIGLPNTIALGLVALLVLIPFELGIILYYSKKQLGYMSIRKMIPYNESISVKKYLWLVPLILIWTASVLVLGKKIDEFIKLHFFSWIPDWFVLSINPVEYDKGQLLIAFIFSLVVTGIIVPIVEELYFRGFLLPRMEWLGKAAPILNACLFAIYHFWSPWQTITRIIALIPLCYVAYKTRNIKITIIIHCLLNILGDAVGLLVLIVS